MKELSSTAWVLIIFLVLFTVSLNIWLFSSARKKNQENTTISILRRTGKIMQNPFMEEENQLKKLSELTAAFKNTPQTNDSVKPGDLNEN